MSSRWSKRRKIDAEVQYFMNMLAAESDSATKLNLETVSPENPSNLFESGVIPKENSLHGDDHSLEDHEDEAAHEALLDIMKSNPTFNSNVNHEECTSDYIYSTSEFDSDSSQSGSDYDSDTRVVPVDCEDDALVLQAELSKWAVDCNITHRALSFLLKILRKRFKTLPNDARSLLKTTVNVVTRDTAGGQYYHSGIENGITKMLLQDDCIKGASVSIQVSVDGLPIFRSSSTQLWPILGRIHNSDELFVTAVKNSPFVIGIYEGKQKPNSASEFLQEFVAEAKHLESSGIVHKTDCQHPFLIAAFICDMPARSFVKCVKGHGAYSGCDRCTEYGVYLGKVTYPECNAPLRTDESFNAMTDKSHHIQASPLSQLSLGLVSKFPVDYMHLVCLGVTRKLVSLWLTGPLKTRLGSLSKIEINGKLSSFTKCVACEFARKPRALSEFERWKATEFRTFLLYTGPVSLKGSLPDELYNNFLLLSVGITILLSPQLCQQYGDYSRELLVSFVNHFGELYGKDKITYNVHGLIHLSDDAKLYGILDGVSAFPFENFLGTLKHSIRKHSLPLQQIVRRLSEARHIPDIDEPFEENTQDLKQPHHNGPLVNSVDTVCQYKQLNVKNFKIKLTLGDQYVQLINGDIISVQNIVTDECNNIWLLYHKFYNYENFFTYPVSSMSIGIFKLHHLGGVLHHCPASSVQTKYMVLPYREWQIGFPVIHSNQQ